jgi:hypothetical protein
MGENHDLNIHGVGGSVGLWAAFAYPDHFEASRLQAELKRAHLRADMAV